MSSSDTASWASATVAALTAVLFVAGVMMVSDPPNGADAAVGKGLLVLALCGAVLSASLLALSSNLKQRPERSRWAAGSSTQP